MTTIRDWNVSRQLWWGHRIPAWYCPDGHVTVSSEVDGPDACAVCGRPAADLQQDPTCSTRGSAPDCGRSPRSAGRTRRRTLRRYYPTSVMETGYDIIFFWVARMMMLGLHLTRSGALPHGLPVRPDPRPGRPEDVQDEGQRRRPARRHRRVRRGRAALRAHPRRRARHRPAVRSRPKLENARNFANKLWNADALRRRRQPDSIAPDSERACRTIDHLGPADRWLLSRAAPTIAAVDAAMRDYAFAEVTRTAVRRDLERVLRLGRRVREGPAGRRVPVARGAARRRGGRSWTSSTPTCGFSTR